MAHRSHLFVPDRLIRTYPLPPHYDKFKFFRFNEKAESPHGCRPQNGHVVYATRGIKSADRDFASNALRGARMSGLRFWRRNATGEEIPLASAMDACLPLFETPKIFGLHEEMLDEVSAYTRAVGDRILASLAVANGWTLVDGAYDVAPPQVITPSEDPGRLATRSLRDRRQLPELQVERVEVKRSIWRDIAHMHGWQIQAFLDGNQLSCIQDVKFKKMIIRSS
mgnify:CR=1 FL=1